MIVRSCSLRTCCSKVNIILSYIYTQYIYICVLTSNRAHITKLRQTPQIHDLHQTRNWPILVMFLLFSPILLCSLRRMRTPDASYAGQHLPAVRTLTYIKQIFIEAPRPRCEGFWFGFSMHQRTSAIMCYPLLELSSYHCSIAIWLCCASWQAKSGQQLH